MVAELYLLIAPNIFKAKDIRTAEAAKLIENIQRDVNIALVNEIAIILNKMNLNTKMSWMPQRQNGIFKNIAREW